MLRYILRRMGYGLLILIGVNLLTFFLFFTVNTPDDMARLNIGGKRITQEQIDKWKAERGYDRPLYFNDAAQGSEKITRTVLWGPELLIILALLLIGRRGAQFALSEATLALAKLVAAFRVELLEREPVTPVGVVTTQPNRSPMFRITPRTA